MQERNEWDIKQLQEWKKDVSTMARETEKRLRELEAFKETTVQQLIVIFDKLKLLQEGDQWIKRIFIISLVGAVVSAVSSLIVWAIQN